MMKLLYNITTRVDLEVVDQWKVFMKEYHIPAMMSTECFDSYKMMRILGDEENDGETYAIQYVAYDLDAFMKYQQHHMPTLLEEIKRIFQDRCLSFKTLMEIHHES